jgi:pyruvate kinase
MVQGQAVDLDDGKILVKVCSRTGKKVRLLIVTDAAIPIKRYKGIVMETNHPKSRDHPMLEA